MGGGGSQQEASYWWRVWTPRLSHTWWQAIGKMRREVRMQMTAITLNERRISICWLLPALVACGCRVSETSEALARLIRFKIARRKIKFAFLAKFCRN